MNNHLNRFNKSLAALIVAAFFCIFAAQGGSPAPAGEASPRHDDLDELSFIEMINSVDLGNGDAAKLVRRFQEKEGKALRNNSRYNVKSGNNVETFRNKEVLLITIPADHLFAPNSTELKEGAEKQLEPIRRYLRNPDTYRVLLTMHTDNTGSEEYRDELTRQRVDAVFDWFENGVSSTEYLFPYAFGDEMPLVPNSSMVNRAQNRRLEIYLMPGKKMLQQASKGRIEF